MSNIPNTSKDSLDYSKFYETVVLQQGIPWLDSDYNEQTDLSTLRRMMETNARYGSCLLPAFPGSGRGFEITGIPATISNAGISAGYASNYGTIVPSTPDQIPLAHEYESDTNRMTEGTVSSVSGGDTIVEDDKKFESWMDLVGCRIKMTSGVSSGTEFEITAVPNETSLECSGGIGSAASGDTYIIKPPALPASVGATTTKEFQLWVFWEWVNSNQDPNIINAGVAIETCVRRALRWCVRAEDTPYVGTPDLWTFSLRILPIASITIEPGDTTLYPVVADELFADPTLGWTKPTPQILLFPYIAAAETQFNLPQYGDVNLKTPRYYYVGTGISTSYLPFFELYSVNFPGSTKKLVGSDGGPITVDSVWINGTTEVTDPSAQASADGFLDIPDAVIQLRLDFSQTIDTAYTGPILVKCFYQSSFSEQEANNLPEASLERGLHAKQIEAKRQEYYDFVIGSALSLPATNLDAWLVNLASAVLDRTAVDNSSQSYTDDGWMLLVRRGHPNSTSQGRSQIWWNRFGEFVTCMGCKPTSDSPNTKFTVDAPSAAGPLAVSIEGWILDSWGTQLCYVKAHKFSTTHGTVLDPLLRADWTVHSIEANTEQENYRDSSYSSVKYYHETDFYGESSYREKCSFHNILYLSSLFESIQDVRTASTTRHLLYEWDGLSFGSIRIYFKGTSSSQHFCDFEIALNCEWKEDTSQWAFNREGSAFEPNSAAVYKFGGSGCVFYGQHSGNITGSRWDDSLPSGTSWVTRVSPFTFTNSGQTAPNVYGKTQEYQPVALGLTNVGSGSASLMGMTAVAYSNGFVNNAPDSGVVTTLSPTAVVNWTVVPAAISVTSRGVYVRGDSDTIAAGTDAYWYGEVHIDVQPW